VDTVERIETILRELPPELQMEVEEFVHFLFDKRVAKKQPKQTLEFAWAGAMAHLKEEFQTSVDLQHESLSWWRE